SLNRGIGLSKGEYIARMDADDISHPERIESQVNFLDLCPKVSLLGTACFRIDLSGNITGIFRSPTENSVIQRSLFKRNIFCHGSVMFRKRAFESVHGYNENFEYAQDFDLWLRLASRFEVGNLSEVLYAWRDHTSSVSSIKDRIQIRSTLKAKLKSSQAKQYQPLYHLNIVRNFIAMITPGHMRNFIRKILFRPAQGFFHFRRYRNDRKYLGRYLDNVWKI
ncbi:MAG: glycosyltransferase, partial [Candidatus Hodarchaeota archaeon]